MKLSNPAWYLERIFFPFLNIIVPKTTVFELSYNLI